MQAAGIARLAMIAALLAFTSGARAQTKKEPVTEVRVNGSKNEPTAPRDSMRQNEVRQTPGAFGDAFRAIESLPGVTPIVSGLPYFFVRGAPPGNTGFFIDGVRVPGLFHLGVGPAVMYPTMISRVDLYKGAYPASYGRYSGGILAAETTAPSNRFRTDWTLRLFDAGAFVEAPFGKSEDETQRGSAVVSGRYGYPGALISVLTPDTGLSYWDYQTRVAYRVTDSDVVSVFAFGSHDAFSTREDESVDGERRMREILAIQFHRVDVRWDRKLSATGSIRAATTIGYDAMSADTFGAKSFVGGTRVYARERLGKVVSVRAGSDAWLESYDFRSTAGGLSAEPTSEGASAGMVQRDVNLAVWADAPLQLSSRVQVSPGVRADLFSSRGISKARAIPALDPRVTSRVKIGPLYHLGAVGIAHQPSAMPVPIPALSFSQLERGLQTGYHLSQGLEVPLPSSIVASVTGFLHQYTGLVDRTATCDGSTCRQAVTRGRTVGLELMVKRSLGERLSGWVSYTFSRSARDAQDPVSGKPARIDSEFDRPHVLNVVGSLDLGRGFRAGARYTAYSGTPYSKVGRFGLPNERTPAFHRVDLRFEKRWLLSQRRSVAITAEVLNALMSKETLGLRCDDTTCRPNEIGPVWIPSLGFEGTL